MTRLIMWCVRTSFLVVLLFVRQTSVAQVHAETVGTAALSHTYFELNNGFNGDNLYVFGVADKNCTVVAKMTGPKHNMLISKKKKFHGAWLKKDIIRLQDVDSFYSVVSSSETSLPHKLSMDYKLDTEHLSYDVLKKDVGTQQEEFLESYFKYKIARSEFQNPNNRIIFFSPTFFRVNFFVPKTVEAGKYSIDVLFIKNGELLERTTLPFEVKNNNLGGIIRHLAFHESIIYAILSMVAAFLSAWFMGAVKK